MADLKALQKKIATLLYQQLSQYFKQVQILSYKPSADGKVSGKFIGDRRNYTFIISNNQVQYLPSTVKMDSTAIAIRTNNVQCTGSNHPCKGAKGTRCVPQNQSCKQREASDEGVARSREISAASKEITALVTGKTATESNQRSPLRLPETKNKSATNKAPLGSPSPEAPETKNKSATNKAPLGSPSPEAPELDQDISLYDFLKYYSPWRPEGSKGFENAKLRDVRRRGGKITNKTKQSVVGGNTGGRDKPEPQIKTEREPREAPNKTKPDDLDPKGLSAPKLASKRSQQPKPASKAEPKRSQQPKPEIKKVNKNNPYSVLGISPKDFPDESALYKAAEKAYRNLARKYHPDNGGDPAMMVELNNMMNRLKSIEKIRKAKERGDSRINRIK